MEPFATMADVTSAPTGTQAVDRAARLLTEVVERAERGGDSLVPAGW